MNKTDVKEMTASLNEHQKYALRRLLEIGEKYRQEKGRKHLQAARCRADYYAQRSISAPTIRALTIRGLVTQNLYAPVLTRDGVKVARVLYSEWLEDYEDRPSLETEAEGITYQPTTVAEYVTALRDEEQRTQRERDEQRKRAVHLWRGIDLPEPWSYSSRSDTMAAAIKHEFDSARMDYRTGINFNLEMLIHVGEQIDALRKGE